MGLTSHFACVYEAFSFYRVYFSLMMSLTMISSMTSLTMMFLGPGYLVHALFHFLKVFLVVSVDHFHLVKSMEYSHLVKSFEYFLLVESNLVRSNIVESIEYFTAQKHS